MPNAQRAHEVPLAEAPAATDPNPIVADADLPRPDTVELTNRDLIIADAELLQSKLRAHAKKIYDPLTTKSLRRFSSVEVARFLGVHDGYIRQLAAEGKAPLPEPQANGRRVFAAEEIGALREFLEGTKSSRRYVPHRAPGEKLQVLPVINFKGGSAKTTTTAHLSQYLALRGYRVLLIDLDPQASLTTLFGFQPEIDVGENETLYGAIQHENPISISDIIQGTHIPGLHIIPGNLELMEFETTSANGRNSREFFHRIDDAIKLVDEDYDVVLIDCPPNMGFLTLAALYAATSLLITIHPQMLDVASMAQFLQMLGENVQVMVNAPHAKKREDYDWYNYLITRYEQNDGPQNKMVGFLRSLFGHRVLQNAALKSTAISDSGLTKQTLYEVERSSFTKGTYDRALESIDLVNSEIEARITAAWGR